jgi:hypothetical protein
MDFLGIFNLFVETFEWIIVDALWKHSGMDRNIGYLMENNQKHSNFDKTFNFDEFNVFSMLFQCF